MKSSIKYFFKLILLLIFISSCGSKFSLQKRRYNKGFYFSANRCSVNKKLEVNLSKTIKYEPISIVNIAKEPAMVLSNNNISKKNEPDLKTNFFSKESVKKQNIIESFMNKISKSVQTAKLEDSDFRLILSNKKSKPDKSVKSDSFSYFCIVLSLFVACLYLIDQLSIGNNSKPIFNRSIFTYLLVVFSCIILICLWQIFK